MHVKESLIISSSVLITRRGSDEFLNDPERVRIFYFTSSTNSDYFDELR